MSDHISAKDWRKLNSLEPAEQIEVVNKLKKKNPAKKVKYGHKEKDVQKAILESLKYVKDGFFWRENSGMIKSVYKGKTRMWRSGLKGISDIMGIYKGIGVAIEVKAPGKKASEDQEAFMDRYRECGGIAFVCDDSGLVLDTLEEEYKKAILNW